MGGNGQEQDAKNHPCTTSVCGITIKLNRGEKAVQET
jgi:hypothetical protein